MRIDRVKLITEMARRDMTVKKLSALSGVSRVTVTGIRSGKACSPETASKIIQALGVKVEAIIQEEA